MSSAPLLRTKDSGLLWRDLNYDIAWEATPGGVIPQDYVFEGLRADGTPVPMKMSELFAPGKDTLALYSFMYGP